MSTTDSGQRRHIHSPDELGAVISELRTLRRKTQFEVSAALSIDRSQLAHLEGGRSGRYLAHLLDILDHLGAELQVHWPTPSGSSSAGSTRPPKATSQPKGPKEAKEAKEANEAKEHKVATSVDAALPLPNQPTQSPATPPTSAPPEAFPSNVGIEETRLPLQREPDVETPPDSSSAQLTKITNLAMNVMAASQQLSVNPTRPTPTNPPNPE
jgi:transcriptional regulator with XRE-family HTH domain